MWRVLWGSLLSKFDVYFLAIAKVINADCGFWQHLIFLESELQHHLVKIMNGNVISLLNGGFLAVIDGWEC